MIGNKDIVLRIKGSVTIKKWRERVKKLHIINLDNAKNI